MWLVVTIWASIVALGTRSSSNIKAISTHVVAFAGPDWVDGPLRATAPDRR